MWIYRMKFVRSTNFGGQHRFYEPSDLEKALGTPAHIYYKMEGVSPSGSHKSNSAVAQTYYNKISGTHAMTTETGAGQWGTALSMACAMFDLDLEVYMVRVSYDQKPYRRMVMETYGAQVFSSPTDRTMSGQKVLAENSKSPGNFGNCHIRSSGSCGKFKWNKEIWFGVSP